MRSQPSTECPKSYPNNPLSPSSVVPKLCLGMRPCEALLRAGRGLHPRPERSTPTKGGSGVPLSRHSGIFIPRARNVKHPATNATARDENIRNPPTIAGGESDEKAGRPPTLSFPSAAWECVPPSAAWQTSIPRRSGITSPTGTIHPREGTATDSPIVITLVIPEFSSRARAMSNIRQRMQPRGMKISGIPPR